MPHMFSVEFFLDAVTEHVKMVIKNMSKGQKVCISS